MVLKSFNIVTGGFMKHIIKYLLPGLLFVVFLFEALGFNFDKGLPFLLVYFFCFFMILLHALLKKERIKKLILVVKYLSALVVVGIYTYLIVNTGFSDTDFLLLLNQILLLGFNVVIIILFFVEERMSRKVS
jgi:hypothetical protein